MKIHEVRFKNLSNNYSILIGNKILGVIEKGTAKVRLELLDYGPHLLNNKDNKTLPIGLQIICGKNEDEKAVEIALALENYLGEPQLPDVSKFL